MKRKTVNIIAFSVLGLLFGSGMIYIYSNKKLFYKLIPLKLKDAISQRELERLSPKIKSKVKAFFKKAEKQGIILRIVPQGGLRSCKEQNELYAKGRTSSGSIVTNAKCGQSWHNFGQAIDVVEIKNGKALWDNENWQIIGNIGKSLGFEWGGDFKTIKDLPHFQFTDGKTLAEMRTKYQINV
tara:strand:- start:2277 stop:2825 length:549 start_codon:yes stop_codon:yes gene_type:complete